MAQERATFSRIYRRTPTTPLAPRVTCSICHFPGVPAAQRPGGYIGPMPVTVTGTLFVGTRADADVTTFDKKVIPVPSPGSCPFCGGTFYLGGKKGSGNAVP